MVFEFCLTLHNLTEGSTRSQSAASGLEERILGATRIALSEEGKG